MTPKSITAFILGVNSKMQIFSLQRAINTDPFVPMQAVIPGVALQQLWDIFRIAERVLLARVGILAGIVGLYASLCLLRPLIATQFGLDLPISGLSLTDASLIAAIAGAAIVAGLLPAWRAVRQSLADGLMLRS